MNGSRVSERLIGESSPHGQPVPLGVVDGSTRPDHDPNGFFRVDVNERWGWRTLESPSLTIKRVRSEREPLV